MSASSYSNTQPDSHQSPNPSQKRIRKLPPLLVNQLAAGEVVTRPASVVKELIENALDAGAKNIEIRINQGGMASIEVRDDGEGIHADDMVMAVTRFATSKVADVVHLQGIATLGFRGEALAATAAVSRLTLTSSADQSGIGRELNVAGILEDTPGLVPVVHPQGTTVIVRDLYFNVPARRGNLKSISTEYAHIEAVVKQLALVASDVSFSLWHNDKRRFQLEAIELSASSDLQQAVMALGTSEECNPNQSSSEQDSQANTQHSLLMQAVLGRLMQVLPATHDQAQLLHPQNLQPLALNLEGLVNHKGWQAAATSVGHSDNAELGVTGFLIPSDKPLSTTAYRLIYINGRLVKDRRIAQCLRECASQIPELQSLGYVLFFNLPNTWLNLNVHPSKQCVKVQNLANVVAHLQVRVNAGLQRWQVRYTHRKQQLAQAQISQKNQAGLNDAQLQDATQLRNTTNQAISEPFGSNQNQLAYLQQQSVCTIISTAPHDLAHAPLSSTLNNTKATGTASGYKSNLVLSSENTMRHSVSEPLADYIISLVNDDLGQSSQPYPLLAQTAAITMQCLCVTEMTTGSQQQVASHVLIQLTDRLLVFEAQVLLSTIQQLIKRLTPLDKHSHQDQSKSSWQQTLTLYQQADNIGKRQLLNQWLLGLELNQNYGMSAVLEVESLLAKHALGEMTVTQLISQMMDSK